jgi:UDP-3-O-[3-hydroxymyristoyl] glucosamine N-acyltransferase
MATLTLAEIARLCGATLEGDGSRTVVGPASLAEAGPDEVSFLGNPRYEAELETTGAGAVLVRRDLRAKKRADLALLRCDDPNRAFSRVIAAFRPPLDRPPPGVHPSAVVDPRARIAAGVSVGPLAVVGPEAELAEGVVLHGGVHVGARSAVGAESVLHPHVVLYHDVRIGRRCIVHAGAVLGSDGFGFEPGNAGWEKIPQCGTVEIGDDVEIGANVTVDRGRFHATRIASGVKIDNLVHIAHNVEVGEAALLLAQVGIAGSSRIGRRAILAGQVGVIGHVTVGDGARVSAQSGVAKDLEAGGDYFGSPARPQREGLRQIAALGRLGELRKQVERLEERLRALEGEG